MTSVIEHVGPPESMIGRFAGWHGRALSGRLVVYEGRLFVVVAALAGWEFVPKVHWVSSRFRFLNGFFISSPTRVAKRVWDLMVGGGGYPSIWPYLDATVIDALKGLLLGSVLGFVVGLALSNSKRLYGIFGVYLLWLNSVPKIAILPIIIVMAKTGDNAAFVAATLVVFFLMFFNCLEGGRSVPAAVFDNARVYGASPLMLMLRIRARYVLQWAFGNMPNAVSHSLLSVITVQIISANSGVGVLLLTYVSTLDSTGTIAVVVYLSVTGIVFLRVAEVIKRRVLHWADSQVKAGDARSSRARLRAAAISAP